MENMYGECVERIWRTRAVVSVCLEGIWRIYMENIYGEYVWRIYMENMYGEYIWRIYMENIHGEYVWRIYGENVENILRLCGECMKDRWKIDGDLAQKSAPCLGFRV